MKQRISLLLILVSFWSFAQSTTPLAIGHTTSLHSAILNETRTLNIYLPEGYSASDSTHYPVIYMVDGGIKEDFFHISGLVRFNNQEWVNRLPPSIVVGIENVDRRRDCSFAVDQLDFLKTMGFDPRYFSTAGGSAQYIQFLAKELQPYIAEQYKVNDHKTIIGESFAGLLATEILLKHRSLFDTYIIISPSLWWGSQKLLVDATQHLKAARKSPVRVYLSACNKEEDLTMYNDAARLNEILKQHGGKETQVHFDYLPNETHATTMHQAVYNAFRMLYPQAR